MFLDRLPLSLSEALVILRLALSFRLEGQRHRLVAVGFLEGASVVDIVHGNDQGVLFACSLTSSYPVKLVLLLQFDHHGAPNERLEVRVELWDAHHHVSILHFQLLGDFCQIL